MNRGKWLQFGRTIIPLYIDQSQNIQRWLKGKNNDLIKGRKTYQMCQGIFVRMDSNIIGDIDLSAGGSRSSWFACSSLECDPGNSMDGLIDQKQQCREVTQYRKKKNWNALTCQSKHPCMCADKIVINLCQFQDWSFLAWRKEKKKDHSENQTNHIPDRVI